MTDADGEWRETADGKARELIAPSVEWLQRSSEDPDAARAYAAAQPVDETPPIEGN
jgi:hypothetical protein